jgi:hypothetical protein
VAAEGPVGFEDRAAVFEPDVLLPSQHADRLRRRAEGDPERRLMIAVLEQGINDYVKLLGARDPERVARWREAEEWVEDRDASWLFSFENVCNVLDLEPEYVRRGLHDQKERAGTAERVAPTGRPTTAPALAPGRASG